MVKNTEKENIIEQAILKLDQNIDKTIKHDEYSEYFTMHACVLTIGWTLLNFTGFVFARYKRHNVNWILYHQFCNGFAALMSLFSGLMALKIRK